MKNYMDGGEAILEAFRKLKIDYIMSSPGSEWSPVWEAWCGKRSATGTGPAYIDCWHETLAVNMATGYTLITGRPQAVLVHAGVGLLQGSMGVHGAKQSEVPMIVMSGESQTLGEDPDVDIEQQWYGGLSVGGIERYVENITKWRGQVTSPYTLYEQVIRAGEMAQRTPHGPDLPQCRARAHAARLDAAGSTTARCPSRRASRRIRAKWKRSRRCCVGAKIRSSSPNNRAAIRRHSRRWSSSPICSRCR